MEEFIEKLKEEFGNEFLGATGTDDTSTLLFKVEEKNKVVEITNKTLKEQSNQELIDHIKNILNNG